MVPQQAPYYPSGAPPVYGQPGFFPANFLPQHQGLAVQVGIPAGVAPGFGSVAQPAVVHVSNMGVAGGHSNNAHPPPFSTNNQQTHFVQGQPSNFVQVVGANSGFADPPSANLHGQWQGQPRLPRSPPPSSFPPGFEPGQSNNVAMGVPSQAAPDIVATGGPSNQHQHEHQLEHQHQHQHQGQHDYQQQHQHQHRSQQLHQHPHQLQNQHQYQHQHQHQHQQQLHHHPQHQHQHQPQHQPQHQQYQSPHHPQLQLHTQLQPAPQLQQFQPQPHSQAQAQPQPQPQSHPQLQTGCQQMQPSQLTSVPFSNSYPPNFQASGVAIGVPVMGTPSHADATSTQKGVQSQQHARAAWQASYPENSSLSTCAPQSSKSTFAATNSFQDNPAQVVPPNRDPYSQPTNSFQGNPVQVVAPKRDPYSHPTNIQRTNQSHMEAPTDPSRQHGQLMPPSKPDSKFRIERIEPPDAQRTGQMQSNGHPASGTSCRSSVMENNHRQWLSPPNAQMRSWVNGRNSPHAFRDFHPHSNGQFKSNMKLPFSAAAEKRRDGQQSQKPRDSRGKVFSEVVEKRLDLQPLRCDPCDRTFTSSEIMAAHLNSHVKCGEEGCTFESTGKILKEHKVVEHGKIDVQSTYRGRKALALRSKEDKEDIRRWREERKKSYPTSANILLKAQEKKRKEADGEFFDEELEKRRQRMRDVITRQKQLGFQVPEIPSHYFRTRYDRRPKKSRVDSSIELPVVRKETAIADATDGKTESVERNGIRTADDSEMLHDRSTTVEEKSSQKNSDLKIGRQDLESHHPDKTINDNNGFHGQGHARKGYQDKFMSSRGRRKQHHSYDTRITGPRQPTLLSKLLHDDIQKENSYLLQCCRFIVNNAFLQDCSPTSLKHFEWIEAAMSANEDGSPANTLNSNAQMKLEMGEMVPTLFDSEYSACGEEIGTLSNSRELVGDVKIIKSSSSNTKDLATAGREIEDAPHASGDSQIHGKRKEERYLVHKEQPETNVGQPCLKNDTGKVKLHDPQSNHVASDKVVGGVQTSVSSWKRTSTSTHLAYREMEAGEVASGNSESIVEDEEDISQYMNFDVTGADSGCCYD